MIIFVIEVKAPFLPAEMNGNLTQIGLSRCWNKMTFHANILYYDDTNNVLVTLQKLFTLTIK